VTTAALGFALALSSLGHATAVPLLGAGALPTERTIALGSTFAGPIAPRDGDIRVMLIELNAQRASRGLAPLNLDPSLCKIARTYATDMATRHFFGHRSPEGETPFKRMDEAHYRYGYAGENIALDADPRSASEALWQSSAHRENILESHYAKVGIGAIRLGDDEIFVEDFSD
jgi:uncharacterized protein YkwD